MVTPMTLDEQLRLPGHEILELLPNEIRTSPEFDVRPWHGSTEDKEDAEIERLSISIEKDGQKEPGIVIPSESEDGAYVLTVGHRRLRSIQLLNERLAAKGKGPQRMRVAVDRTGRDHLQTAIITNIQRKNLSQMDLALLIERLREKYGWSGFSGVKSLAKYLGLSTATITQTEKLRTELSDELQERVHLGIITAQSALELMLARPELRPDILKRAEQLQAEEDARKESVDYTHPQQTVEKQEREDGWVPPDERKAKRIQHPNIRQAIREQGEAIEAQPPLNRKELIQAFEQFDSPEYGHPNGAVRRWLRYFIDDYATGKGKEQRMRKLFTVMVAGAYQGTVAKSAKAAVPVPEAVIEKAKAIVPVSKANDKAAKTAKKASKGAAKSKDKTDNKSKTETAGE